MLVRILVYLWAIAALACISFSLKWYSTLKNTVVECVNKVGNCQKLWQVCKQSFPQCNTTLRQMRWVQCFPITPMKIILSSEQDALYSRLKKSRHCKFSVKKLVTCLNVCLGLLQSVCLWNTLFYSMWLSLEACMWLKWSMCVCVILLFVWRRVWTWNASMNVVVAN